jgi:hypothetical protein
MSEDWGSFTPGGGLKDDYDGFIRAAAFLPSDGERTVLVLKVNAVDGEEVVYRVGIGNDWESFDGGATVRHSSGDGARFNSNTHYSDFIVHAVESGAKDVLLQIDKANGGHAAQMAATWVGLGFHWEVKQRPVRVPKRGIDGEIERDDNGRQVWVDGTIARALPTAFLGERDGDMPSPAPAPSANTASVLSGVGKRLKGQIEDAAKKSDSYQTFIDAMLELTDEDDMPIMERLDIASAAADESWYQSLHNA